MGNILRRRTNSCQIAPHAFSDIGLLMTAFGSLLLRPLQLCQLQLVITAGEESLPGSAPFDALQLSLFAL